MGNRNQASRSSDRSQEGPRQGPLDAHSSGRHAPDEQVAGRIEAYVPRDVPEATWNAIRGFVIPALRDSHPVGVPAMERFARCLTLIAVWCHEQGIPLDVELVLDPDTVERFCATSLKNLRSWGSYRSTLRRLGRQLTKRAPWGPPPAPMPGRRTALPYSEAEMQALREDASRQSTASRRRAARALIALGAGAGLDGRWNKKVRGVDIERLADGVVVVHVAAPRPRVVPVLRGFEDELLSLAEEAGDEYLLGGKTTNRNRSNELAQRFEDGHKRPRLVPARLRSTWVVTHLAQGTRLPELLEAAGTSRIETFDTLLDFVPALDEPTARRLLRGGG